MLPPLCYYREPREVVAELLICTPGNGIPARSRPGFFVSDTSRWKEVEEVLHRSTEFIVSRLASIREGRKEAQLKRRGYRELREPRLERHWANR